MVTADPRAHGGDPADAFHVVTPSIRIAPEHVVGVHGNGALGFPTGAPAEFDGLSAGELERLGQYQDQDRSGYAIIQATWPQTLAFGLTDSPAAQLAWTGEKFAERADPAHEFPEHAVDRDQLLTDVSIY
ncbi:hypothetical protein [Streptomyces rimosus]|uniref:hypothetical protein n=1 Tax=Streptomyces rimosus TaxID=1927 RepID=UPI00067CFA48|nr:hypothetical protein [Streptomyces rimosus]